MTNQAGRRLRFLHAADLHLGSPFIGLSGLPAAVRTAILKSTYDAFARLIELAIRSQVDAVLISGDVYDAADRPLRAEVRFQRGMERLAAHGIPAFVIHGNHDPADGRAAQLSWPPSVHFFSSGEVTCVPLVTKERGHVADVWGISYPTPAVRENYALRFPVNGDSDQYNIGLLHANVGGDVGHDNYAPCDLRDLLGRGIDYWALGHIHSRRVLHEEPWIVYPGNPQGRSIRETDAKGCYIVDVSCEGETRLSFHTLDAVRWLALECAVDDAVSEQDVKDALERCIAEARLLADGRPAFIRVMLHGRAEAHRLLRSGTLLAELTADLRELEAERAGEGAADFVWIESIRAETGLALDRDELLRQGGFLGDLVRTVDALHADESAFEEFAEQCLAPLMHHSKAAALLRRTGLEERLRWLKAAEELAVDWLSDDGLADEEDGDA